MGEIEKQVRKRDKKANLQKTILTTLFACGGLSIALFAPKMLRILKSLEPDFMKDKYHKYSFNRSISNLKNAGLITLEKNERGSFICLTPKGESKLRQLELIDFKIKKSKRWDGKWRLLMFDVKEERKGARNKIRYTLRQIGFMRLQDSVWVYPYDCEDLVMLLKADFKIGKDLLYVVADVIENDKKLRQMFGIKH